MEPNGPVPWEVGNLVEGMPGQSEGKITPFRRWLAASPRVIDMYCGDRSAEVFLRVRHVPLVGASLATPHHLMVTCDQEQ